MVNTVGCVVTVVVTGCGSCVTDGEEGKGRKCLKGSNKAGNPLEGLRSVNMSPICVGLRADVFVFRNGNGFSIERCLVLVVGVLGLFFEKEILLKIKQMVSPRDEVFFDAEEEDAPVQEQ